MFDSYQIYLHTPSIYINEMFRKHQLKRISKCLKTNGKIMISTPNQFIFFEIFWMWHTFFNWDYHPGQFQKKEHICVLVPTNYKPLKLNVSESLSYIFRYWFTWALSSLIKASRYKVLKDKELGLTFHLVTPDNILKSMNRRSTRKPGTSWHRNSKVIRCKFNTHGGTKSLYLSAPKLMIERKHPRAKFIFDIHFLKFHQGIILKMNNESLLTRMLTAWVEMTLECAKVLAFT